MPIIERKVFESDLYIPSENLEGASRFEKNLPVIANALVEQVGVSENDDVLLWFDRSSLSLVSMVDDIVNEIGARVQYFQRDLSGLDGETVIDEAFFEDEARALNQATKVIIIRDAEENQHLGKLALEQQKAYSQKYLKAHERRLKDTKDGGVDWILFSWPNFMEAQYEGMEMEEYLEAVATACDRDWVATYTDQAKIKEHLDDSHSIMMVANEDDPNPRRRTKIHMKLRDDAQGMNMTVANSVIWRNLPGSELFTGPIVDSANGQIFSAGQFVYDGLVVEDVFLRFEHGQIVEYDAAVGREYLDMWFGEDSPVGNHFLGEVALGTNYGITRRMLSIAYAEKMGGSFHITPGECYSYTEYKGEPVNLNNGNTAELSGASMHWDIVVPMLPEYGGGRVVLNSQFAGGYDADGLIVVNESSGYILQKDGLFNPKLGLGYLPVYC